jgi:hypothetical protein
MKIIAAMPRSRNAEVIEKILRQMEPERVLDVQAAGNWLFKKRFRELTQEWVTQELVLSQLRVGLTPERRRKVASKSVLSISN